MEAPSPMTAAEPADAELLRRARSDPATFRALYDRYAERVHRYHLRRCGDPHAAQDLTAETFARAWIVRTRFRDRAGGSAGPWLFGIARNVLLSSVRARRLERSACERLGLRDRLDRGPARAVPDESWLDGADELLDALPPGQADAVRLHVIDDLDYDAAAERLETTPQAVRARVSRGLRALRLRHEGGAR